MKDRGSAVVEFALITPLILLLVLGIVEVAVVARTQLELINAAREGAREAAASPDPGAAVAAARSSLGSSGAAARVRVRRPHVVGQRAEVSITLQHRVARVVFGGFDVELSARSSMRVER